MQKVAALIVNYNSWALTRRACDSLLQSEDRPQKIYVVDNCSDKEADAGLFSEEVIEIISNSANLGYAAAVNIGMQKAVKDGADFVFLLNPDAFCEDGCLRLLLQAMEGNKSLAVAAPRVVGSDFPEILHSAGTDLNWFKLRPNRGCYGLSRDTKESVRTVQLTPASAWLIRVSAFTAVGPMDERYFLIHEDSDYCLRIAKKGLVVSVVDSAYVQHDESYALSKDEFAKQYYSFRNFLFMTAKLASLSQKIQVTLGVSVMSVVLLLKSIFNSDDRERFKAFVKAAGDFLAKKDGKMEVSL